MASHWGERFFLRSHHIKASFVCKRINSPSFCLLLWTEPQMFFFLKWDISVPSTEWHIIFSNVNKQSTCFFSHVVQVAALSKRVWKSLVFLLNFMFFSEDWLKSQCRFHHRVKIWRSPGWSSFVYLIICFSVLILYPLFTLNTHLHYLLPILFQACLLWLSVAPKMKTELTWLQL